MLFSFATRGSRCSLLGAVEGPSIRRVLGAFLPAAGAGGSPANDRRGAQGFYQL